MSGLVLILNHENKGKLKFFQQNMEILTFSWTLLDFQAQY